VGRDGRGYTTDLGQAASGISEIPNPVDTSVFGVRTEVIAYGQTDANDPKQHDFIPVDARSRPN
jgi:hypothetical protein